MRPARGLIGLLVVIAMVGLVARRWLDVVEVRGGSMAPFLLPGDRLIAERISYARRAPRVGEVVLAPDPRVPDRELIKRVASVGDGVLDLRGDAAHESTDSRAFGGLPLAAVRWRVVGRYWPVARIRSVSVRRGAAIRRGRRWRGSP